MSTRECIDAYLKLSDVSRKGLTLEQEIKKIVIENLKKWPKNEGRTDRDLEQTLFKEDEPQCRV